MASWYFEGYIDDRRETWRTNITQFPFVVGRKEGVSLRLASPEVSGHHAELFSLGGELWLRDLGSKNGSYVNDTRVSGEQPLAAGDILRFANWEFRLVSTGESATGAMTQTVALPTSVLPRNFLKRMSEMRAILEERRLVALFQPIVHLEGGAVLGYEALGRGLSAEGEMLPPNELFELAGGLEREAELSDQMRDTAIETLADTSRHSETSLFVNTHPAELREGVGPLLASLARWVERGLPCRLVLEIHEAAIASPQMLRDLASGLVELDIDLAFDDFGTGQARLLELVEVAPRYLKFDRAWVSGIDAAPANRRAMVERMVILVRDLGVATLAEGVETEAEASVCREMGFELAQGWHYGRPARVAELG